MGSPVEWKAQWKGKPSGRESPVEGEVQTGMCQYSTSTFEDFCGCTALEMPESRELIEQIDGGKATITSRLRLEISEVLRSSRH